MLCEKSQPGFLYPLLLGDEVNFRLTYDGPLKAASQSDTRRREKHLMRCVFNRQLHQLIQQKALFRDELERSADRQKKFFELANNISKKYKRGNFNCMPIVRSDIHLVCDLDILFLRREHPGRLIQSGGDLDNRIKVLFDSLRVPMDDNEVRDFVPDGEEEKVLICLTEDDKLITGFRVTTDRLLEPPQTEAETNNVRLIIQVEIRATKLVNENMGYFGNL